MNASGRPNTKHPGSAASRMGAASGGRPHAYGMGAPMQYPGAPMPQPQIVYVQQPPQEQKRKKRGCAIWIAMAIALVAIVLAVLLALSLWQPKADRSGELGQLEGKTPAEIQAEIDRVVAEGMFNISIASVVEFADGTSPGELRIENVPNNNYLMRVVITRADTGEKLYETGVIEPNHHIQADTLDVDLPQGTYDCLATFTALDMETEEEKGQVAAQMTLNVLS